jgi:HK97 family phage portal protein
MKLFGIQIGRTKSAVQPMSYANTNGAFGNGTFGGGWFGVIREGFAGAFQAHVNVDAPRNLLGFSAVYSCVTLIANDIAKLQLRLMVREFNGNTWTDRSHTLPQADVLRRPNHFQTRSQFVQNWIISKLLWGNTYVLKERNAQRIVTALYVLDPTRVKPLITPAGGVYYELAIDNLSGVEQKLTVPATEIIHDRINCLWHPLVGVSPLYACGTSATVGNRIQGNSAKFFENMSRPSGMLTAPQTITDETAGRLKGEFEQAFSGAGLGRLFVAGDGLQYNAMTITAIDAQLIEQLNWTVVDIARAFHVPLFKVGAETGRASGNLSVEAQQQLYLNDCLQSLIEDVEECLDLGLELPRYQRTEFDLDGLLRMDSAAQYESLGKAVGGGWMAPNEARERVNLPPVAGGATPYLQVQNYSLAALDKRDQAQGAPATAGGATDPGTKALVEALIARDALHSRTGGRGYITRDAGSTGGEHER